MKFSVSQTQKSLPDMLMTMKSQEIKLIHNIKLNPKCKSL